MLIFEKKRLSPMTATAIADATADAMISTGMTHIRNRRKVRGFHHLTLLSAVAYSATVLSVGFILITPK